MRNKKGFTLVELMVAVSLFTIVAAIVGTTFISILDASQEARENAKLSLEIDFILEDISRNVRTGSGYVIDEGGKRLSLTDENGCTVTYEYIVTETAKSIRKGVTSCAGGTYSLFLNSSSIVIESFYFTGDLADDPTNQPRVRVFLVATLVGADFVQKFPIQTSITQRRLEFGQP